MEFSALLQRAVTLAGDNPSHVIVISIPDRGGYAIRSGSGPSIDRPANRPL